MKIEFISDLQKEIVKDKSNYKIINGCAGSRKTDTLIKGGIYDLVKRDCNILFLTLVGSVTNEIKQRLESYLKIEIKQQGTGNHYLGVYNKKHIEIANFDAWVYKQLQYLELENLSEIGSEHNNKIKSLLDLTGEDSHGKVKKFCMKNNKFADSVFIDEVQDLEGDKMQIIINILKQNKKLRTTIAGDYLQTIFEKAITSGKKLHPLTLFSTLKPKTFNIDICYRCPKAHVDFCNLITKPFQEKYRIKLMKSNNNNTTDKPFLFTHGRLTNNSDARFIAEQVTCTIKYLIKNKKVTPGEIAIIMAKSNNNSIFEQLRKVLNDYYKKIGYSDSLKHFNTNMDGYHKAIDWSTAKDKTVMLSVHGDKGKSHKAVFFLGCSQKSIPRENDMYKYRELLWQSLLNVGLTRSTKYLFVGFTNVAPSIYLSNHKDLLKKYCYCSWEPELIENKFYKRLAEKQNKIWKSDPNETDKIFGMIYRETALNTINKDIIRIRDDVARRFEKPRDLGIKLKKKIKNTTTNKKIPNPITVQVGKRIKIDKLHDDSMYPIIGYMAEIILLRKVDKKQLIKTIEKYSDPKHIYYTEDEKLLNIVSDHQLNEEVKDPETWKSMFLSIKQRYGKYLDIKIDKLKKPKYIVSNAFNTDKFRNNIKIIIGKKKNKKIKSKIYWNVALLWNEIHQLVRKPYIYDYLDFFEQDISGIHKNVKKFIKTIGKAKNKNTDDNKKNSKTLRYQMWHSLEDTIKDKKTLKELGFINKPSIDEDVFLNGYKFGIHGFSDFYDCLKSTVIEVKASKKVDFSSEWLLQTLMYATIKPSYIKKWKPKKIKIFNVLAGKYVEYELPKIKTKKVVKKIMKYYEANEILIDHLKEKQNSLENEKNKN